MQSYPAQRAVKERFSGNIGLSSVNTAKIALHKCEKRLGKFLGCFDIIVIFAFHFNFFNSITMQEGTVKFFNETKGFGFIKPNDGGEEIFVHVSGLIDKIRENDHVTFDVQNGRKGLNAINVKLS